MTCLPISSVAVRYSELSSISSQRSLLRMPETDSGIISSGTEEPTRLSRPMQNLMPSVCLNSSCIRRTSPEGSLALTSTMWVLPMSNSFSSLLLAITLGISSGRLRDRS